MIVYCVFVAPSTTVWEDYLHSIHKTRESAEAETSKLEAQRENPHQMFYVDAIEVVE